MGIDTIFKVGGGGGLGDKCARSVRPIVAIQNLKIGIKNRQFAAIILSQFWCMFGYATIITLCFGLSPMIFAMPVHSV